MKFHRGVGVAEKTAWHTSHRIGEALKRDDRALFAGAVEVDEKDDAGLEKTRLTSSARGSEPSARPSRGHERQGDKPNRREGR